MSELGRAFGQAWRRLRRDRSYTLPVLLTLTLCLAANAAVFTVVDSVLLRPLPLEEAERLVTLTNSYPKVGVIEAGNSPPDYFDRRAGIAAFEELGAYIVDGATVGTPQQAERLPGVVASPSMFTVLRVQPFRGRLFAETDGEPGREKQVVLAHGTWQRLFAGRDEAVGSRLSIDGESYTVVGVLPPSFRFLDTDAAFWVPLALGPEDRDDSRRGSNFLALMARLRPGATLAQAEEQLHALDRANLARQPQQRQAMLDSGYTSLVTSLHERVVRDVRGTLGMLWAGVLCVLLIGGGNVANLALVRASARAGELAARESLGASRGRLLRQMFGESLILCSLAAAGAIVLTQLAVGALARSGVATLPRQQEIAVRGTTLLWLAGASVGIAALLAACSFPRRGGTLALALREEGRGGTAGRTARSWRRTLLVAQVGFAFVLLLVAGLLLASFRELLRVRPGFDAEGVLSGKVSLPYPSYPRDQDLVAWSQRVIERLRALPGVTAAAVGDGVPLAGGYSDNVIRAEGVVLAPGEPLPDPAENSVTPGYFAALRIPLLEGRVFDARDSAESAPVLVVDRTLADRLWPGQDPIGKRVFFGRPGPDPRWVTVVGVVGEVKQRGLASPEERIGAYYYPYGQLPFPYDQGTSRTVSVVVRTAGDAPALAPSLRRELAAIDPQLALFDLQTMEARLAGSLAVRRLALGMSSGFGLLALLLATVGLYGVFSYQVTQRRREIGIRLALGSQASRVFASIVGEGAALVGGGLALGLVALGAARRALAGELYGVSAFELPVVATMAILLSAIALAACAIPARRAACIDPVAALSD